MRQTWADFLTRPAAGHGVQVHSGVDELAESVATYLVAGFEVGEPALVVATPEHLAAFRERLSALGSDVSALEASGLLTVADAEATLSTLLEGELPSAERFEEFAGAQLDAVGARSAGRPTRVFGEMVDLLCRRGRAEAAIALEELWRDAAQTRRFSLLCGYRLDVFDRVSQSTTLPWVCELHSHVLPARHYPRFAHSVDRALDEVLGSDEAGRIYVLMSSQGQEEDRVPLAQRILMWVSANRPLVADRVLASARAYYLAGPAPSA
jgi:MEDS: MEthanogen/methylotroph, DcmR Sensory domain